MALTMVFPSGIIKLQTNESEVYRLKLLCLTKRVREANRQRSVTIHPNQLEVAGIKVGDEVEVYVKGKKIIIEKKEV